MLIYTIWVGGRSRRGVARGVEHVARLNNGDARTPALERREAASSWSRAMALAQDDGNVDDVQLRPEFILPRGGTPPSFLSSVMASACGGCDGREFWSLVVGRGGGGCVVSG